jgi:formylglycine-generating enzyme required for sulfatase activity
VRIRPFCLGIHEVTQAQYKAVIGINPSYFSLSGGGRDIVTGLSTDNLPVENVSWLDAVEFCNKLSEKEGLKPFYEVETVTARVTDWTGPGYHLPTEAEWQYACRADSKTRYSFGNNAAGLGEHGWYDGNSGGHTQLVGQKRANAFGLFDMHGNVWEWCWDVYSERYYQESQLDDPRGPAVAGDRAHRSGYFGDFPLGSAVRGALRPTWGHNRLGFRVAPNWSDKTNDPTGNMSPGMPVSKESQTARPPGHSKSVTPVAEGPKPDSAGDRQLDAATGRPAGVKPPPVSTNSIGMKLALIPAGKFVMVSSDANASPSERPEHKVRLSTPFYMGVTEVTQAQYELVMENNPSYFSPNGEGKGKVAGKPNGEYPVEQVSWFDAVLFCNGLSKREHLAPYYRVNGEEVIVPDVKGRGYRLPTEAEWEYACRGGKSGPYSPGPEPLVEYGWFRANSDGNTHAVAKKRPNEFGLYDMAANV